jgi:16S rRNA (uracil1498-N3)-methyltransferase
VRVRRLFVTEEELSPEGVVFSKSHTHYLLRVLRLKPGDLVEVMDGQLRRLVKLSNPAEGILRGTILESHFEDHSTDPGITLAFACVRPGPTEDILQHCTELGVRKFVPILAQRAARRPRDIKDRWLSILAGAAAQSRQSRVPELSPPVSLADFLSSHDDASAGLLLSPDRDAVPILECLRNHAGGEVVFLVGPEGGFEASEESDAVEGGFTRVSLGTGVLRSETAAIVAVASVGMWRQWRAFSKD